tara:strand:+ start:324 stop:695 length:372 start_codon:yes stop_codon:yes gene_type:complete
LNLLSNREDWSGWLADLGGQSGSNHKDEDGQEGREQGSESVVHTTVLVNFDHLVDRPPDQVNPREGGGEGKSSDDSIKRLRLEFRGDECNSLLSGSGRHFFYTINTDFILGVNRLRIKFFYTF